MQMLEIERISQEMRDWKQKACETKKVVSVCDTLRRADKEELQYITLSDNRASSSLFSKKQGRKARMEPYVSQIPISVKQLVDQQKKIGRVKNAGWH